LADKVQTLIYFCIKNVLHVACAGIVIAGSIL